jgi:hypothetical protein
MVPKMLECRFGWTRTGLKFDVYASGLILWSLYTKRRSPWKGLRLLGQHHHHQQQQQQQQQ